MTFDCPHCGQALPVDSEGPVPPWDMKFTCGCCREIVAAKDALKEGPGHFPQVHEKPRGSLIDRRAVSDAKIVFHVPGPRANLMIQAVMLWTALLVIGSFISNSEGEAWRMVLPVVLSSAVVLSLFVTLANRSASELLFLEGRTARVQQLTFRKRTTRSIPISETTSVHVRSNAIYRGSWVELATGNEKLRLAMSLTNQEQEWLASEIRAVLDRPKTASLERWTGEASGGNEGAHPQRTKAR